MKKLIIIVLVLSAMVAFTGCGIERDGETYGVSTKEVTVVDINGDTVVIRTGQYGGVYRKK